MIDETYLTKEVDTPYRKKDYKSKEYLSAVCPRTSNQYHIEGKTDEFLKARGYTSVSQAKKDGWEFKNVK